MMIWVRRAAAAAAVLILAGAGAGCSASRNLLAFATATTFGLDISLRPDNNLNVTMGYDRAEIASIPVPQDHDASATTDAYSVLGYYHVDYGNPWSPSSNPLTIKQLFATGQAAMSASSAAAMGQNGIQDFLARKAATIAEKKQ